MSVIKIYCLAVVLATPPAVSASEFTVPAGKWRTTVTTSNPFLPAPMTNTRTECRQETAFDPSEMMKQATDCTVRDQRIDGNLLTFTMECRADGGALTGKGRYRLDGDRMEGGMDMTMDVGGQAMNINLTFTGERLGDC